MGYDPLPPPPAPITSIVEEINRRFCNYVYNNFPEKRGAIGSMAAIGDNQVRMANLCLIACFSVNGRLQAAHRYPENDCFRDFNDIFPGKLTNVTNGITARRWLNQGNPLLADMITGLIGDGYVHDLSKLSELKKFMKTTRSSPVWARSSGRTRNGLAGISPSTTACGSTPIRSSTYRSSGCMSISGSS